MGPVQMNNVPPGDLVVWARKGDQAAWEALTTRYAGMLWAIARGHGLGDTDAADVAQTTWLRLVERIDHLRQPDRVGTWLAVTARREAVRVARRAWHQGDIRPLPHLEAPEPGPEHVCADRERLAQVIAAIHTLPALCREVLRLFAVSPAYADVAAALGIPVGSVGPTRARCLTSLRKRIGGTR
ncbi:MAG TPA: sigma-70 family RNA polymerase sigma factor [Actinomadura sp.]|nr:sigma-70 family RNA polymerase sigma factor [Actinomadura sp.]